MVIVGSEKLVGIIGTMAQQPVTPARARRLLIEQGFPPVVDKEVIKRWTLGSVGGKLRRMGSKPTLALRQAVFRLEREGKLRTSGLKRPEPKVTVTGVTRDIEHWSEMRLLRGQELSAALIRDHYAKQFRSAGGAGEQLTDVCRRILTKAAMEDRLTKCPEKTNFLVLFSGWQSTAQPSLKLGLTAINAEIDAEKTVSVQQGLVAAVERPTDLSLAREGEQVKYACQQQGVRVNTVGIVEGSHPCETFSNSGHINTERGCNYQFPSGAPRPGPKKQKAVNHRRMAANMVQSVKEWIVAGAMRGEQLYCYLEQGQTSTLKKLKSRAKEGEQQKSAFEGLPPPVTVDYCQYKVQLGKSLKYPARKSTSIWTNIRGWTPRRCPGKAQCQHHACKAGATEDRIKIPGFTVGAAENWIPEELHLSILEAAVRPR